MPERLDKFLWAARFIKSRAAAQEFIERTRPRINRNPTIKPHSLVREGDIITFAFHRDIRIIKVIALSERRLSPDLVRTLFEDIHP